MHLALHAGSAAGQASKQVACELCAGDKLTVLEATMLVETEEAEEDDSELD